MTPEEQISMNIAELEQALLAANPMMPNFLKQIHSSLLKQPELVHIIKPEERAIVIKALSQQAAVEIVTATKSSTGKKAATKMTLQDLGL